MAQELGFGKCINCEAKLLLKVDKTGKVYFNCHGNEDPDRRACGFSGKFGKLDSKKIIEAISGKEENDEGGRNSGVSEPEPETGNPEPKPEPAPEKRSGILDAIFE